MGKRVCTFFITTLMILSLAGCAGSGQEQPSGSETQEQSVSSLMEESPSESGAMASAEDMSEETSQEIASENPEEEISSTLVVFFSRHGNAPEGVDAVTSASLSNNDVTILADMIVEITGEADLHQIITAEAYPAEYDAATQVARTELDEDARPALANSVENMEQYGTVYLGYPIWWGTIPMPVATFLESYDFSGKTIIPFCTHEGSGLGPSGEDITQLATGATVLEGFAVSGNGADSAQGDVEEWLHGLDLIS